MLFNILTSVVVGNAGDRSVLLCAERRAICPIPRSERFTATKRLFRRRPMCKIMH